jgi:2-polyprenyl-3-methyl-5-hydroxy-6-metoxy-1,4-benzoquinol methylase
MPINNIYTVYNDFYLARNKVDAGAYDRQCRGFRKKLSPVLAGMAQKKVLDVGCGCGFLVYFLKNFGFEDVTGIDLNEQLISLAKSKVSAKLVVADAVDFLREHQGKFDIIFLWNLLEHIDKNKTIELLSITNQRLSKDGFVVIRTPNMTNFLSAGHFHDDFTHLSGFTEQSIRQVASLAGFSKTEFLNQFKMQNFKGKIKAILNAAIHKFILWLRGGTKCKVFYRNLYAILYK